GGARAGWLAAQRPEWAYLLAEPGADADADGSAWADGPPSRRIGHLTAARRRDPAAARELLAASWSAEPGEERGPLLSALRVGLGPADEDFLERALDDRRARVRDVAAGLLAELPGSRYQARRAARATACVRRDGDRLVVTPPVECDAAMQRDGVAARPPVGVGARAWWLEEIVARAPLRGWGAAPAALLALPVGGGWAAVLHRGLARAAATFGDAAWAAALLEALLPTAAADRRPDDALLVEGLYSALAPAAQVALARRALAGEFDGVGLDRLLDLCPAPWPVELGTAVADHLAALFRGRGRPWRAVELSRLAALRMPASLAGRVAALAAALHEEWPASPHVRAVETLAGILRFRHDMIEELA
ncbi:MAG TPA: DUF5691 domain-containing protein, partial [Pilimelia sp.]|nr:DUF5691 domain-containing protein [Pilimelia sp.]